jgi:RimJ/RimL family protein N-acetyltransferase
MPDVALRHFGADALALVEPWFDDPEVVRRLGDRSWPARRLALIRTSPGTTFRGRRVVARGAWIAYDGTTPVGLVDAEVYDRAAPDAGASDHSPGPAAALALAVDPTRWGRGYGRAILRALVEQPELAAVRLFEATAEPDNPASIRCLEAAGFARTADAPDDEGMLGFVLRVPTERRRARH